MNQPNIIYVFADQWRRQAVGYMAEDCVLTPNIDAFAAESVVFNHAVSCSPICSPHRASLMTGKHVMSHGVVTNCKPGLSICLQPDKKSFANVLKKAGYRTGYIGKWHLDEPDKNYSERQVSGARGWDAYTPPGIRRQGFDFWYSYGACDRHLKPHYWQNTIQKIQPDGWSVEHETQVAIDFIDKQCSDKPFALFVSWNPPHTPFDEVPEKYKAIYEKTNVSYRENVCSKDLSAYGGSAYNGGHYADEDQHLERYTKDYFAAVSGIDDHFGQLIRSLKEKDLYDNTIICLSSDHGELLGSHSLMNKMFWYEESIGIPFMVRMGKRLKPKKCDIVFNSIDHMPTVLGLAGIEVPVEVEGIDVSEALIREEKTFDDKTALIVACDGRMSQIENDRSEDHIRKTGWRAIRSRTHTYVVNRSDKTPNKNQRLLYDLEVDPYQMKPMHVDKSSTCDIAFDLEEKLKERLRQVNDPFEL